ncbi:MAG: glycerophosphodiester phosphodiesterase [Candidatus Melainabacteria bacterium]|nr:MAG: glycerophosphodiester phosphodiesterase [Candidatus Melainabacteria bacterium]
MVKPQPANISHRGGRHWAPENTLVAFKMSLDIGVEGLELDVQRCASGELVVIHDELVNRTTNGVGLVEQITYDELKRLDAGSFWHDEYEDAGEVNFKGEKIPLLKDVLDLVDGRAFVNVELKNTPIEYPGIEDDLIDLLSDYRHRDKIIVSSFDHRLMYSLKEKESSLSIALLADALFVNVVELAQQIGADYFHPCFGSLRKEIVEEAHAAGLKVNAWTINTAREWAMAVDWELDGVITDAPHMYKAFLEKRKALST